MVELRGGSGDHILYHYTADWTHERHPNIVLVLRGRFERRSEIDDEVLSFGPGDTNRTYTFRKGNFRLVGLDADSLHYCISRLDNKVPVHERVVLKKGETYQLAQDAVAVVILGQVTVRSLSFALGQVLHAKTGPQDLFAAHDSALHVFY